jgi:ABC-2 type transport system ATP-binding protein
MENSNSYAIQVSGLVKRFGDFTAVGGIDFQVRRGEIFCFLGPNGSGKTTTIRMMLGLLKPTAGSIEVLGFSVYREPEKIRPHIGYMSQRFSLYNDLTVLQNLRFYGKIYGLQNRELEHRIREAIELAGLIGHENSHTRDLAGGWRQRLALGAAIMHEPQIVFLDEPTAGVDPLSRRAFWELLYQLTSQGITIFVTTHYMDEAEHCHQLAFIQRGKIIALGSPEQIKREKMHGQVLEIEPSDTFKALKTLLAAKQTGEIPIEEVAMYGSLVHIVGVDIADYEETLYEKLQEVQISVNHSAMIEPSLEDVFISCVR